MPICTRRIERPRTMRELEHAIRYGRYVDGALEYHHDRDAREIGEVSTWTLSVAIDDDDVIVRRIDHLIASVHDDGSRSLRYKYHDPVFKGSLDEFLKTQYADTFCERFQSSLIDLSAFDDISKTVGSKGNEVWIEQVPIKSVTRDLGNNERFERLCDVSVTVYAQDGYIDLAAYDGWKETHEVAGITVDKFIELIELARLIQQKKISLDVNDDSLEVKTKGASATFSLSER